LGSHGLLQLRRAKVIIVGTGLVGSSVGFGLYAAGVVNLTCIDCQLIEPDQVQTLVYARPDRLGQPKATVLAEFLSERGQGPVAGIFRRVQAAGLDRLLKGAALVVSCANRVSTRCYVERHAIASRVPVMQVAADDSRDRLGGLIHLRTPDSSELACYGCLLPRQMRVDPANVLLPSVASALGHMAVQRAVLHLSGLAEIGRPFPNLYLLDLQQPACERLTVRRRPGCRVCGS
jgi:adenylyltransferase/sulfurtransferase